MTRSIVPAFLLAFCCLCAQAQITVGESVSRNEFGIDGGTFISPSGTLKAVYVKDESAVSEFPLLNIRTRTGELKSIKYPMNGMPSEKLLLQVRDSLENVISTMQVNDFTDERYLTGISWSPDDRYIFIQVLDRAQHHMHLNMYRAEDGSFVRTLLTEENDAWVEPLDPLYNIKGSYRFIYRTNNRDGYRNLYELDTLGHLRRLTVTDADVQYMGNDGRYLYYTSAEVSPIENHLFRLDLKKKKAKPERLTKEPGWHRIIMAKDCSYRDVWSSLEQPPSDRTEAVKDSLLKNRRAIVELGSVKSADGKYDNYYRLVKPLDFDPQKKYPLVLYVYGGPHSQMVTDSWMGAARDLDIVLAEKGFIVYTQDNRGTQNRGMEYEQAINRRCGQVEMEDQMAGLRQLLENSPWIDSSRIGVSGWSYGGFMTISLMTTYPDMFKAAACGGPVIDWKWYEVMYGERYMDTPQTNPEGFEQTSLINKADRLKGKLLICQGMNDETVLPINSLSFVQKCVELGIQLDYFPYPVSPHNVERKWRQHLLTKFADYFTENL